MHNLTKAGGPMLESVINELAVMPLPLPPSEADANRNAGESQEQSAQLRKPTQEERRYASELIVRLLDTGIMRKIGAAQRRMAQLPDGAENRTARTDRPNWKRCARTCSRVFSATTLRDTPIW